MKKLIFTGLTGLTGLAAAGTAHAQASIMFESGASAPPSYTTAQVFEDFSRAPGNGTAYDPTAQSDQSALGSTNYTETVVSGSTVVSATGSEPGFAVAPDPTSGRYLAIQNGTFSVSFGGAGVQVVSFTLGTLDIYNSITLNFGGTTPSETLTGAQIIGQPVMFDGNGNSTVAGQVTYDVLGQNVITSIDFSSTKAALEIDNIAAAAPEPATWIMMILGFGMAGTMLRSRRKPVMKLA